VIRYLADSSAVWRLLRDPAMRSGWADVISDHAIGSCQPQRTEFRRSARNLDEYEQMTAMFTDLYPGVRAEDGVAVGRVGAVSAASGWGTSLYLPKMPSRQVKLRSRTREGCHQGGHVDGCLGGRAGLGR
jgi:hypothetical protein